jgi:hypothetical protein
MKNAGRGGIHVMRRAESECGLVGPSRAGCWLGWEVAGCGCAPAGCNFVLLLSVVLLILVVVLLILCLFWLWSCYFSCYSVPSSSLYFFYTHQNTIKNLSLNNLNLSVKTGFILASISLCYFCISTAYLRLLVMLPIYSVLLRNKRTAYKKVVKTSNV